MQAFQAVVTVLDKATKPYRAIQARCAPSPCRSDGCAAGLSGLGKSLGMARL